MKKLLLLSFILFVLINCTQEKSVEQITLEQGIPQATLPKITVKKPTEFIPIDSTFGDLDNDGIEEKVIVLHNRLLDDSTKSEIRIYKQQNQNWELFYISQSAILNYIKFYCEGVEIEKGILKIYHNTGGQLKSSSTQKYRYQNNDFELIGFRLHEGILCDYWKDFDYNLSTGKINYKKETENCTKTKEEEYTYTTLEQEIFYHKLDTLPKLSTFEFWTREIESPKHKALLTF